MKRHFLLSVALLFCAIIGASRAHAQTQQQTNLLQDNETVHTVPFFEGFEEGNRQNSAVQGWQQQSEKGSGTWLANSTETYRNRAPYAGKWNATLQYSNTRWLFTSIRLEAGKLYRISMQARQDYANTSYANIRACLGKAADKDSMNITILPETSITNGDYQTLTDTFRVAESGVYALGIRGYISGSPYYLSLDNICIDENKSHTITALPSEHCSLSVNKTTAYAGDTVTLTANVDEGYWFNQLFGTPAVRRIDDTRFIMPDEDVAISLSVLPIATVPFFEGFEEGNTQDAIVQGWKQQDEYGSNTWNANSTRTADNRTPYAGNWNATLYRSNTRWLFTSIRLEAGKLYRISMQARQDEASTYSANIRACLGKTAHKDSMTTTILAQTDITNGEYQTLTDTFRVAESGVYVLGIRGYISGSPYYLSLDNIRIDENKLHTITLLSNEHGSLSANKPTAYAGDTITLIPNMNEGYMLNQLFCTPAVRRIDNTRFIMPDEDVTVGFSVLPVAAVPFFEGFENGNKQDSVVQGWIQQRESGSSVWKANSTNTGSNRTPYAGSWNATLSYNNTDWLFTYIRLEAGKQYRISMMARQDMSDTSYANIRACLGKAAHKDSMNITILPETSITNGDYQLLTDTFRVAESGIYALGIRGYINNTPYYLSLDNIRVDENKPRTITFLSGEHGSLSANKPTAYAGDTVTLIPDMEEGYTLCRLLTMPAVRTIDNTHFIMPDEDVTIGFEAIQFVSVPFFEGFENGNTQDSIVQGWLQQSENGNQAWCANSIYSYNNRAPYAGKWNANLYQGNTDWLFTYIRLEAGKQYRISMMARQAGNTPSYAKVRACLGYTATKDAMTTTILAETSLTDGDYQLLTDTFSVATTGVYVLGIRGYINSWTSYLSMDNIRVDENEPHTITFLPDEHGSLSVNKPTAYAGDTVTLTTAFDDGYTLHRLLCNPVVHYIDATRFIMPDEDLTIGLEAQPFVTLPFFEGFEEGNTQGAAIAGWLQQSTSGDSVWQANSTFTNYGRAPHTGSWNAVLYCNNTDWMFRYVALEAGKTYRLSMYARQSSFYENYTSIQACLGTTAAANAMNTKIFSGKRVASGDYRLLTDTFRVAESGVYALGIYGYISSSSTYMSFDDIRLSENTPHTVHTTDVALGTIIPSKAAAYAGDTVTLTHTMADNEIFLNYYVTNEGIRWLDNQRFIMPDEEVTVGICALPFVTVPFFEGFENGNTDQAAVAGWGQQSEVGSGVWCANTTYTTYNRTPYAGSWNAVLSRSNTDWLFKGVVLEANTEYELSFYTRQDYSNSSYANVSAFIGNGVCKDSMKLSILPETGITYGKYQLVHAHFSVPVAGRYVLGIRGYISSSASYLVIDNIRVRKYEAMPVTAANPEYGTLVFDKPEAYTADTVTISRTMNANCYFRGYTTNVSVKWIDANRFIMPDTAVTIGIDAVTPHTIPFVEDFEDGNTQGMQVAGWIHQNTQKDYWTADSAHTGYNDFAYSGKWNAYLEWNKSAWMFNALALEANKEYILTFRARRHAQDIDNMYVQVSLGTDCNKDSMKVNILRRQYIKNGDFQLVYARFSVSATGNYVLGIYGYSQGTTSSECLAIDDIRVTEYQAQTYTVASADSRFGTLSVNAATAHVGDTITVSHTMAADYVLDRFTTSAAVRWISATQFIMPDENVEVGMLGMQAHALPFFDGFEEGNEQGKVVTGWKVAGQNESYYSWNANSTLTTYNRSPYEGSWHAYLYTWNSFAWMFNAVTLEAGKTYTFSIRAKQSSASNSSQKIKVCLGNVANAEAMTTTILPETVVQYGDYQAYVVNFTVQESGTYALGIYGCNYAADYLSIDNIRLMEKPAPYAIHLATSEYGTLECPSSAAAGDTVVVRSMMNAQYVQSGIVIDKAVRWVTDSSFVMPDEEITLTLQGSLAHTLPFFDGFENGNEQGKTIVGWGQQSEKGGSVWAANSTKTDYNRTPYEGSWNATLAFNNTDWLFCALWLEQGKRYRISLYARQDGSNTSQAEISVYLGSAYGKDAMTLNILPATAIINGDYQRLAADFTVPTTAAYAMGIRGYIGGSPYYISLDNILVEELPSEVVTAVASETTLSLTTYTEEAIRAALSVLTLTAVDDNDSTVCTITNDAARWVIDLPLYTATYTLTIDDLPASYVFADDTETLRVTLKDISTGIDDAAMGKDNDNVSDNDNAAADKSAARLIIEQNTVYVLLPDGTRYTVTGQKLTR